MQRLSKEYNEEDYLMLSGIQHFYFCKRQWCLIHIENIWADNQATKEGEYLHEKVDNPLLIETRKDVFYSRGIPVVSKKLGFSGVLDMVEFHKSSTGIPVKGREGLWEPIIIEYKRGKEKKDQRDIVQLVAEVICLEEGLGCAIKYSYLFYDRIKKRQKVEITPELRDLVYELSESMHQFFEKHETSQAENYKSCSRCSLYDLCLPRMTKKKVNIKNYIKNRIEEEEQ